MFSQEVETKRIPVWNESHARLWKLKHPNFNGRGHGKFMNFLSLTKIPSSFKIKPIFKCIWLEMTCNVCSYNIGKFFALEYVTLWNISDWTRDWFVTLHLPLNIVSQTFPVKFLLKVEANWNYNWNKSCVLSEIQVFFSLAAAFEKMTISLALTEIIISHTIHTYLYQIFLHIPVTPGYHMGRNAKTKEIPIHTYLYQIFLHIPVTPGYHMGRNAKTKEIPKK